jgi:uncharacterized protein (UPF0332 family)
VASSEEHLAKAERFLATARWALGDGDTDSCASRAEYAAHHAMVALLLRNGRPAAAASRSKHQIQMDFERLARRQYTRLRNINVGTGRRGLSQALRHLSDLRERADYRGENVTPANAREALLFVDRLITLMKEQMT